MGQQGLINFQFQYCTCEVITTYLQHGLMTEWLNGSLSENDLGILVDTKLSMSHQYSSAAKVPSMLYVC